MWRYLVLVAVAIATDLPPTTVLTSFFGSFPHTHISTTHFRNTYVPHPTAADAMEKLQGLVDSVVALRRSERVPLRLVVLHDIPGLAALADDAFESVELGPRETQRYADEWPFLGVNDMRFIIQRDYARRNPFRDDECVFLVDASDVRILRHPGRLCAAEPPARLFVGNDVAGTGFCRRDTKAGRWSKVLLVKTHYAWDEPELLPFLDERTAANYTHFTFANCGIVGGRGGAAPGYLERAGDILHRRERHGLMRPVDMVIVNHLAAFWPNGTVYGFPEGPVNLPFHHDCSQTRPPCDYAALEASGRFFFSHK